MQLIKLIAQNFRNRTIWKLFSGGLVIAGLSASLLVAQPIRSINDSENIKFKNLNKLMQDGIHEHFTALSFSIYHDESPIELTN
jgi:hypothetical protein